MSKINITRCVVAWSLKNIRSKVNDSIVVDSTEKTIDEGYYTFSDLGKVLATHGVIVDKLLNNHVTDESSKDFSLGKLGTSLLEFGDDTTLAKDTKHTSNFPATMTNRIKNIHVYCSLVDSSRNYSYLLDNNLYYSSSLLFVIPIDTTQPLNGNFTDYVVGGLRLPCRSDYYLQDIEFIVESGGHPEDYEIFMTFEIE